ncbi:MAG: hypothetical protein ABIA75_09985 [Candidatus Neomarinimicrobiota bacterium]
MPEEKTSHRRHRRKRFAYLREFSFELSVMALFLVGGFLLVEKTDVSAIVTGWLKAIFQFVVGGITNAARDSFDFFATFESSDIVGYMLILLGIHLLVLRGRKRLFKSHGAVHSCPYCGNDKMQRVKRIYWHKLLGLFLILRIKNYQCKACSRSTITFSSLR